MDGVAAHVAADPRLGTPVGYAATLLVRLGPRPATASLPRARQLLTERSAAQSVYPPQLTNYRYIQADYAFIPNDAQLRWSLSVWGGNRGRVYGVRSQSSDQEAICKAATDALEKKSVHLFLQICAKALNKE